MSETINERRRGFAAAVALALGAIRLGMGGAAKAQSATATVDLPVGGGFPPLSGANAWLNSQPLAPGALRGNVVVVNFCTYTCINWLRSLPYVRAWADKYRNQGLVVIGVHSPEFGFEKDVGNVERALKDMRISYPIAVDSDHAVWRAFDNDYWPALYFIDAQGRIRHRKFGEGDYAQSERVIQSLLAESGRRNVDRDLVAPHPQGVEAQADWDNLETPETYVGYRLAENFASPGGVVQDTRHVYAAPGRLGRNQWALAGDWTTGSQASALNRANGRIACRFHARDLNLVLGPTSGQGPVPFRVMVDGKPPVGSRGLDVDGNGNGTIAAPRLYQLVRQPRPIVDRQFDIEFLSPGAQAFVFTFG